MIKKEAKVYDFNEEKEKRANLTADTEATAPSDPNDPNWLSKLESGTVFLAMPKADPTNFILPEFALKHKTPKTVLLLQVAPSGEHIEVPVEPYRFCRKFSLHEILLTAQEREYILQRNKEEKGITVVEDE